LYQHKKNITFYTREGKYFWNIIPSEIKLSFMTHEKKKRKIYMKKIGLLYSSFILIK